MLQQKIHANNLISLVKHLYRRQTSTYIAIFGRRGSGKTDLALLIMEILQVVGYIKHHATNVKIYDDAPFHLEKITDLWNLKKWCRDTQGPKLFILDEIGRTVSRRTPMARLNVKIINELQILRKYKLSLIIVTVDQKYTDNAILGTDLLDGVFNKVNYQNPKLALYHDNLEDLHVQIADLPKTEIPFDTWDSAPFTEKPATHKPDIKDSDLSLLWDWAHGATYKELGVHNMTLSRKLREFVKERLEKDLHVTQA